MTLTALRVDALTSTQNGFALRLSLPWIRSLPLASLGELAVVIDAEPVAGLRIELDGRRVASTALAGETAWWFLQDRIEVRGERMLAPGAHDVRVSFRLMIPYLQTGPDGPLSLPFEFARSLLLDAPPSGSAEVAAAAPAASVGGRIPADPVSGTPADGLPAGWTLAASAFNWTPDVILAERTAGQIAVDIVADGLTRVVELEPGQLWRSFPQPADEEVDAVRDGLAAVGGHVSMVGASLDDWQSATRRRDHRERLAFLLPQLRAARRVGATGVRLPIGQAGEPLLRELLPLLHELDLVLFEEIQGQQTPDSPGPAAAIDAIARIDDPNVRVLVDISMLMPALPITYLDRLRAGGVPAVLMDRLTDDWRDPATSVAVADLLRAGGVPPDLHTLYMDLIVRFGRSDASDLRGILPLVGAFHLKFWDLDDADGRVSRPIRELGAVLGPHGFAGTLTSEWGGHAWLDTDATEMTRAHLALAAGALSAGAAIP